MTPANRFVAKVLRSPMHRLLSASTDLVRYTAHQSGREITTPTQYARHDGGLVILVGRSGTKTWWRNFRTDHDLDVLVRGRWMPMTARAVVGVDEPDTIAPLLDSYLARFPRSARALTGTTRDEQIRDAVIVWCRPRQPLDRAPP